MAPKSRFLPFAALRRERSNHTLQSTALVHEAFMRLVDQNGVEWRNRAHFFAIAAQMMRRILVDYARAQGREKRGSGAVKLELNAELAEGFDSGLDLDILALNSALDELARLDSRQGRVVELRFFAGLSIEETAEVMKLSPASIKREWNTARAWLFREMTRKPGGGPSNPGDPQVISEIRELTRRMVFGNLDTYSQIRAFSIGAEVCYCCIGLILPLRQLLELRDSHFAIAEYRANL
jgi:RNA polymerase sigma factor (TIGR02999 family)